MMEFSPITFEKIEELRPLFAGAPFHTCDYSPGGLLIWKDFYKTEFCSRGEDLYLRLRGEKGELFYLFPLAKDPQAALAAMPRPLSFCAVPREALPILQEQFPDAKITAQPEYADYYYAAEDLRSLKGKKFSAQRNHISRFKREYPQWSFSAITDENRALACEFYRRYKEKYPPEGPEALGESAGILEILEHPSFLGMVGGMLMVEEEPVGISFGELQGETLHVHIEKADRAYKGVYQMLTNQFACAFGQQASFINREDDMGDAGLRKAKLAYHPVALLEKYLVEIQ